MEKTAAGDHTGRHLDTLPLWRKLVLGAFMCLVTSVFGLIQPYTAPYLRASGLTALEINLIGGTSSLFAVAIQPLLGRLSDRIDARRPLILAAAATAATAYHFFPSARGVLGFLALSLVGANSVQYLNSAGGVLIGRLAHPSQAGAAYARYRVWGSIGYVATTQLAGWLLPKNTPDPRAEIEPAFTVGTALIFAAIALLALGIPDPKLADQTPRGQTSTPRSHHTGDPENFKRFLGAYFLYSFALYGASANLPLFLTEHLNANQRDLGNFFAIGVIAEVLVMTRVGSWTDRHGRRPALLAAFCLLPVRLLAYVPASTPLQATLVQSLHGLNFGIVGAVAVIVANDCASPASRGLAQARLAGTAGVALALGQWTCGAILQRWGFGALFSSMAAVATIAAAVLATTFRESHPDKRPMPAVDFP